MEESDFGGYATRADVKCKDGRVIKPEAFKHMHGVKVPLVWQHGHNSVDNILGHGLLEAREDGVYVHGFFNETKAGLAAKALVMHKDIDKLSIYANQLKEYAQQVLHGMIREVSLVLAGANPGAFIDYVRVQHSEDPNDATVLEDEAVIHTGLTIEYAKPSEEEVQDEEKLEHAEQTLKDLYDSFSETQKNVVHYMIGAALEAREAELTQSQTKDEGDLEHQEGTEGMATRNVFDQTDNKSGDTGGRYELKHSDAQEIFKAAKKSGNFMEAVKDFALAHGIDSVESLFPDAKSLTDRPEWIRRRSEWVDKVINGTRHLPFAKIKNMLADLTYEEARAKGYITGEFKKEQWFPVSQRTTGPTTVYKKQKMDRDTLLDITDFDAVAWLWEEMRFMIKEELARAILLGDGRAVDDPDKIKDPEGAVDGTGIRSILHEHHVYVTTLTVNLGDANSSWNEIIDELVRARSKYRGSGSPDLYLKYANLAEMLLIKDTTGRKLYPTKMELAATLGVNEIIEVEIMEESVYDDVVGIYVNLADYSVGTNRGGELTTFEDFNLDYNQHLYLIETRLSGALTKYKSAVVIKSAESAAVLVVPNSPTFVKATGVVTIVATTGVVYKNDTTGATLSTGAQSAIPAGDYITVRAEASDPDDYYLRTGPVTWTFKRDAS